MTLPCSSTPGKGVPVIHGLLSLHQKTLSWKNTFLEHLLVCPKDQYLGSLEFFLTINIRTKNEAVSPSLHPETEISKSLSKLVLKKWAFSSAPLYPEPCLYYLYLQIANDVLSIWGSLIFYPFYYRLRKRNF